MSFLNKIIKKDDVKKDDAKAAVATAEKKVKAKATVAKSSTSESETKTEEKKVTLSKNTRNAYKILVKPLVTEKASVQGVFDKYFFSVSADANKSEVKKAIKNLYNVTPIKINILNKKGKVVRFKGVTGRRKDLKKAIITLKKGEKINIYEGV